MAMENRLAPRREGNSNLPRVSGVADDNDNEDEKVYYGFGVFMGLPLADLKAMKDDFVEQQALTGGAPRRALPSSAVVDGRTHRVEDDEDVHMAPAHAPTRMNGYERQRGEGQQYADERGARYGQGPPNAGAEDANKSYSTCSMAWRPLVARVKNWTREAYVPLRIMLHPDEGEVWRCALGVQGPCTSVVAGFVLKQQRERLSKFSDLLEVTDDEIIMKPQFRTVEERSQAFQKMEAELKQEGAFPFWQDEFYMAKTTFSSPTLFNYHRGVGPYFGLSQFATHLNGFVRDKDTGVVTHVWIATRAASKKRWPLMHDTIVGGGLPAGISALDNMVKEAQEEAGLEPSWARQRFVAAGRYVSKHPYGLTNDTMFIFDLELPRGIAPVNQDGEVESFDLLPVQDALSRLWSEPKRFKPDVCILLLDFFIRHGVLTADNFTDYEELQRALHNTENLYDAVNHPALETDTRLYVQNLPAYVDSARLREHFATQGEVTDACVIRTKDGSKSRRFGFVGFKSATQAEQARKFFHQSFFDTCRINVRVALARESDEMERPWSKYSVGSGRYQKLHPETGVVKTEEKISPEKDIKGKKTGKQEETSGEFQEFMETMQARSKTKFWANDDVQGPVDGKSATKSGDVADAEDSDDEYQELGMIKADEEEDENMAKSEKTSKKSEVMSDMDFLRSKITKNIDKVSDDEDDDEDMENAEVDEEDATDDKKAVEAEAEDDKPTARLFVRNLPFTAVEEDLEALCSTYGPVEEVHMPLDDTRRRKGYGFVLFRTTVDAQTALTALNGMAFQGRRLHVIFARSKPVKLDPEAALADPNLTYKQRKELERQIQAQKKTGWNASYIRGDATVGSLAERMGVKRGEIMDKEQGNMAVRLAIGETMLVKENKDFFAREGVDLDAIEGAIVKKPNQQQAKKIERSTTVILIKNLPHTTEEEELAQLFRKHGEIGRFLLPPSKTLAVVEFLEPSEARKAFRSLAYKNTKAPASEQKGIKTTSAVVPDVDDDGDTAVGD
ncbi:RNA-binding protein, partial [Phytophthora palmivora]